MTKLFKFLGSVILVMTMSACSPDSIPEPSVSLIPAGSVKGFRFEHYNKATNSVFFLYTTQDASYLSGREWIEYSRAKVQSLTDYLRKNGGVFTGDWLVDCSISGEIEVTSDIEIDGRPAGSNLSDLLYVRRLLWIHGLICSFPDYRLIGMATEGMLLKDWFAEGNALPYFSSYDMEIGLKKDIEYPESFKLTIRIPIHAVDWSKEPWKTGKEEYYDTVLQGEIEIQ